MAVNPSDGIGRRLSRYRRLAGLSAQQLSDKMLGQLSRGMIANIERGAKRDVTVDQVFALAYALQVPPVVLMLPVEEPERWVRVIHGPDGSRSLRSLEFVHWALDNPDPFHADRTRPDPRIVAGSQAAAFTVARSTLRAISEYGVLWTEVERLEKSVVEFPERQDVLDERREELEAKRLELNDLGVDLTEFKIDE